MVKVSINTYGSVNKEVGWDSKEVKLEPAKVMVEDNVIESKLPSLV